MASTLDKEHLVVLHRRLAQIRVKSSALMIWREYDAHGVLPHHVHRSKQDHYDAILLLADAISELHGLARAPTTDGKRL